MSLNAYFRGFMMNNRALNDYTANKSNEVKKYWKEPKKVNKMIGSDSPMENSKISYVYAGKNK